MDIEAVCFDLDGTLYDDRQYFRAGFRSAAELLADRVETDAASEFERLFFDQGIRANTFDRFVEQHDLPADLVPELVEAFHSNDGDLNPYSEVPSVLAALSNDYALGLITGGRSGTKKIERLNIGQYFDTVLVTPDHGTSKRSPEPFEEVLDRLSTAPSKAVYVGDNPELDFAQPNRLGMYTVRVLRGLHVEDDAEDELEPDAEVNHLGEFSQLLC